MSKPKGNQTPEHLAALQKLLSPTQAILISRPSNIAYFFSCSVSQIDREAFGIVSNQNAYLLHSPLIHVEHHSGIKYHSDFKQAHWQKIAEELKISGISQLLIDEEDVRVSELKKIKQKLSLRCTQQNHKLIWQLRMYKSESELASMRRAGQIASKAVAQLKSELKVGMTEVEAARRLESIMIGLGANAPAFPTIVAFNQHTANPHHLPGTTALAPEMPVLIDCGASVDGYCSDLTRTYWFGKSPSTLFNHLQTTVLTAYKAGIAALHQPISAQALDAVVRNVIEKERLGKNFIHTTGHGLGLDIHEPPGISPIDKTKLKPGMVITIEPGIYLADKIGYRHENTFALSRNSIENLTAAETERL